MEQNFQRSHNSQLQQDCSVGAGHCHCRWEQSLQSKTFKHFPEIFHGFHSANYMRGQRLRIEPDQNSKGEDKVKRWEVLSSPTRVSQTAHMGLA